MISNLGTSQQFKGEESIDAVIPITWLLLYILTIEGGTVKLGETDFTEN